MSLKDTLALAVSFCKLQQVWTLVAGVLIFVRHDTHLRRAFSLIASHRLSHIKLHSASTTYTSTLSRSIRGPALPQQVPCGSPRPTLAARHPPTSSSYITNMDQSSERPRMGYHTSMLPNGRRFTDKRLGSLRFSRMKSTLPG